MENVKNTKKWLMLFIAAASIASCSLSFGMNIWNAIEKNNISRIKELVWQKGFDFNQTDKDGRTPLSLACRENNLEIVKLLLPNCSIKTVNKATNNNCWTPLYWACWNNNIEIVKLLLEHGANINQKSLNKIQAYLQHPEIKVLAQQILATFNLTQRFDKWVKTGEKFDLTMQERQDKRLGEFAGRLLKSRRKEIIKKSEPKIEMNIWDAIDNNDISRIEELFGQEGFDSNQTDNDGNTPLNWAYIEGNLEIVKLLLSHCSIKIINKANNDNQTPLNLACFRNNLEIIRLMLDNGAKESVNTADNDDRTPLYNACGNNNLEIVKLLLPNCSIETVNKTDNYGNRTPLYNACRKNNLEIVRLLLEHGANIDQKSLEQVQANLKDSTCQGVAQLMQATFNLTQRFDKWVKTGEKFGLTPEEGQNNRLREFADRLLHSKRKEIIKNSEPKIEMDIWKAIEKNNTSRIKKFVEQEGFDSNQTDKYGETPLSLACTTSNLEIVRLLLDNGASVNKADNNCRTPFYWACINNDLEMVRLLLPYCSIETVNKAGNECDTLLCEGGHTPLYEACENNNLEIVRLLLNNGAKESANNADKYGNTPLYKACFKNNLEIVRLLLEHGANIDQKSLRKIQNILQDQAHQAVARQIKATFNLTQRFDKWVKTGEKFDLTAEERQDQGLCKFKDSLLNSQREKIIKESMPKKLDKALKEVRFERLDDCTVKCEFDNLQ